MTETPADRRGPEADAPVEVHRDSELVDLSRDECLELLRTRSVGRLSVVADGRPDVFLVNYAVADDGSVVVRTEAGTMLTASGQWWVAFEVDDVDAGARGGWSVVVRGVAFDVTETLDARSVHLQNLVVDTWAPGPRARRLAVTPEIVTGRRLNAAPDPASDEGGSVR